MSRFPLPALLAGLAAAGVVAALLVAAWAIPGLAVAIVWPLLFVVPGWGIVAWARPRIGSTGRLGLAIVLSVAISAHLVYWLSMLVGGYRRETIFLAAAILALPIPIAVWRGGGVAVLRAQAAGAWHALRREPLAFAFAGLATAFVGLVLDSGLWHPTETGISAGGSNWSDLGVHLSIAQSLNAGNFPPDVPYFAGAPLVYHWFADFHAAIVAEAAGLFAVPAFVISSAVLTGALALLVHGLARLLLRAEGARRAAIIAAVLVVIGGGLGWIRFVADLAAGHGDPIALVTEQTYDNFWYDINGQSTWPYFRIPSVMGTGLLVHRATTAGLPILVGAVLLMVAGLPTARARRAGWRDRPQLIALAGLLGALLAPFHFFFFPAFILLAGIYVLLSGRLFDGRAPRNAALFLGPFLLAFPFVVPPLLQAAGSGSLHLRLGWESAPWSEGEWGPLGGAAQSVAFFYITNLGIPFLLAMAALIFTRTRWRLFLGVWVLALFAVPNLLQVSAISFDANKYFQAMWIAVALLAAWLIRRWPLPAVALVLLLSVPSPLLVAGWTALNREQVIDWQNVDAANWIAANTPERSVFATDGWLNAPTDPAGRLRLLTYAPYVANLGFDPNLRVTQVQEIYCGGDVRRSVALMRQLGATYLLDGGRPGDCLLPTDFATTPELVKVYENPAVRIWQLTDAATADGGRASVVTATALTTPAPDTGATSGAVVALEHLTKRYGPPGTPPAVTDLSLTIPAGEICVLVGPSGCGKTTTMKMINRLIEPTGGKITIDGRDVMALPPVELRRGIGYVIQQVGLFPHLTVAENVAVVPRLLGWSPTRVTERVDELLDLVGLAPAEYRDRYPAALSGGERQRVGVGRALAADPPLMLMDEPFGAVDPIRRDRLQNEFLRLQDKVGKTVVFVTHDVDEAIKMADRIAILERGGILAQYDTPDAILAHPASEFVERFVGADRGLKRLSLARVRDVTLIEPVIAHAGEQREAVRERIGGSSKVEYALLLDERNRPIGWMHRRSLQADGPIEPDDAMPGAPTVQPETTLRDALSALLSSSVQLGVVVDERDAVIGLISVDAISEALRTAVSASSG